MRKHKIAAVIVAALTIATLCVGASAANRATIVLENSFSFSFSGYGGNRFSSSVTKNTARTFAEYVIAGGNVSSTNPVTVLVTTQMNVASSVSESKQITSVNGTISHALSYDEDNCPGNGASLYFAGVGSYYSANMSGSWLP